MKKGTKVQLDMEEVGRALRSAHGWSIDSTVMGVVEELSGKTRVGVKIRGQTLWFDKRCVKAVK